MSKDFKYQQIARIIENQITTKVLVTGNKLPSLRQLCTTYGISQSTALAVYYELEAKSYVTATPKSGYYVSHLPDKVRILPETSNPGGAASGDVLETITERIFDTRDSDRIQLAEGAPAAALLPVAKLNKAMLQAMRSLTISGIDYDSTQGSERLRQQIVRHTYHLPQLTPEDLIITSGCINALSYALMATTRPGDTIAVESPVYFGILRLAKNLQLNIIELPTHPITGIVLESFEKTLKKHQPAACILVSNFSNPLGSLMPDTHKKEVVRLIQLYGIPLIEDDIYGDLHFGSRPTTCKSFDNSGLVLLCSSFSKTLAPGYRVGWIAPGKFKKEILRLKRIHTIASPTLPQEAIASFLENGRYDHHLRKLRRALHTNCIQYTRTIDLHFPESTRISSPQGGMILWVELDKKTDTLQLFEKALQSGVSIAPGKMFTLQNQFGNCLRLNYGMVWNPETERALQIIGGIAKEMEVNS